MGQNYPSWWTTFRGLLHLFYEILGCVIALRGSGENYTCFNPEPCQPYRVFICLWLFKLSFAELTFVVCSIARAHSQTSSVFCFAFHLSNSLSTVIIYEWDLIQIV